MYKASTGIEREMIHVLFLGGADWIGTLAYRRIMGNTLKIFFSETAGHKVHRFMSCIIYVISVLFCYAFVRICLLMPCGHLLGKG